MKSVQVRDKFTTAAEVRDELIDQLKKFMVGPQWGNNETIDTGPGSTYVAGKLYPQDSDVEQENVPAEESQDDEVSDKTSINSLNLSSFGLTCMLDAQTEQIKINVHYGTYSSIKIGDDDKNRLFPRTHHSQSELLPIPKPVESTKIIPLDIDFGQLKIYFKRSSSGILCSVYMVNTYHSHIPSFGKIIFQPNIEIISEKNQIKHNVPENYSKVTGSDENLFELLFDTKKNFGFGHGCSVTWNDSAIVDGNIGQIYTDFIPQYTQDKIGPLDPESLSDPVVAQSIKSCMSMKKLSEETDYTKYSEILLEFPKLYSNWINTELESNLETISDKQIGKIQIKKCQDTLKRINEGINIISTDPIAGKAFQFMNKVMSIQRLCVTTTEQNKENKEYTPPIIENASGEWRLFQLGFILMNVKSFLSEKNSAQKLDGNDINENDIRDSREIADLLWFPTGGGKTEAYLGMISFVMAMRRLTGRKLSNPNGEQILHPEAFGTSVLMRYTLRLLTIQQFQRAASLMCACEYVRRQDLSVWGNLQFSVGLWVGQASTPNQLIGKDNSTSAESTIARARQNGIIPEEHNPMQLLSCPWCGDKLDAYNYEIYKDTKFNLPQRMRCYCKNNKCFFNKNNLRLNPNTNSSDTEVCIPILTVDDDIYDWCPSLLISTVDKFAQIAYNPNIANIFGKVNIYCTQHGFLDKEKVGSHKLGKNMDPKHIYFSINNLTPPDLIVQDELHLISGPLGTLTALYETAIDYFCKNNKRKMRPKIIASTATTKSANIQIETLFNRRTNIFPPQGFEFGKTFFSTIDLISPGKIFLGISPTARSPLTTLAMTSGSLMRRIRYLREQGVPDGILDPYYTLISYFNSKRELGGAFGTYSDTVPDYFDQIFDNIENRKTHDLEEFTTEITNDKEEFENEINAVESNTGLDFFLDDKKTEESKSNVSKSNVSERKKYVNTKFISDELTSRKDSGEIPNILKKLEITLGNNPLDYLLCTNMLSVGVDIQRLGIMIVNGQPKNHSEYIQSTGRIGRKYPGLILTVYNSLKPRDLSHYENFRLYHSAFFKYVEPISITPFSARSRDTGLFAVCVGMIRNMVPLVDRDPANFNRNVGTIRDAINEIKSEFSKRVSDTDNKQREQTLLEIDEYMETWENLASQSTDENKLKWKKTGYETESQLKTSRYLLVNVEHGDDSIDGIPKTPMSLRDAEQLHNVYFYESQLDDSEEDDLSDDDKDVDELMGDKK